MLKGKLPCSVSDVELDFSQIDPDGGTNPHIVTIIARDPHGAIGTNLPQRCTAGFGSGVIRAVILLACPEIVINSIDGARGNTVGIIHGSIRREAVGRVCIVPFMKQENCAPLCAGK